MRCLWLIPGAVVCFLFLANAVSPASGDERAGGKVGSRVGLQADREIADRKVAEVEEGTTREPACDTERESVRAAILKSLSYLESDGTTWMEEKGCMSCHHVPFMVWTHREAKRHGLPVDENNLKEWEEWCRTKSLSQRHDFLLSKYELGKIPSADLPEEIRAKLADVIDKPIETETEFVKSVQSLLSEAEWTQHQAVIMKTARLPDNSVQRTGGGLDVQAELLLSGPGSQSVLVESAFLDGVGKVIQRLQRDDGAWTPGNQLLMMRRWSTSAANQTTTMWIALALAAYKSPQDPRSPAIEKAIQFVGAQEPIPDNREWLATKLIFESQLGAAEKAADLRNLLIASRNSDGGWGWEKDVPSDAHTTGLALYALASSRGKEHTDVIAQAQKWLLDSQQPDGSWKTPSKNITKVTDPDRLLARDEIYHYWGTGWAALGLLASLDSPSSP